MTDKELRRMSRRELLEMLISQTTELEQLKRELSDTQAALRDRQIAIDNTGSLAEACLQLNGVFDAAQAAAQQYLDNLRQRNSQQERIAEKIQTDAKRQADSVIASANEYSRKVHAEADAYWKQVTEKARALLQRYECLQKQIKSREDSP